MCLKDFGGVVHSHRNDRASGFAGDFETSFMERKELQLVCICVSSTFREDTDGDAGFYFFDRGQDSLQPLFDIFSVKEQTVKITHPVGKKRVTLHFFLGDVTGADRAAAVAEHNVKIALMVSDVKHRCIFRNIFFTDDRYLCAGFPQDKFENSLNDAQGADFLCAR